MKMQSSAVFGMVVSMAGVALYAANTPGREADVAAKVLRAADRDGDGKLGLEEYKVLDVQAQHHGDEHFAAGDANHDGRLDVAELAVTLQKQTWFVIHCEGIDTCFARLDVNHDGKLDPAEYRVVSRMGHHAEQHFHRADKDGDGFLNKAEFTAHANEQLDALARGVPATRPPGENPATQPRP